MKTNYRTAQIVILLGIASLPLLVMYAFLVIDSVTTSHPGSLIGDGFSFEQWRFLWQDIPGKANIWRVSLNTLIFATATTLIVLAVASTAGYALSRLNMPFRAFFLASVLVLHAFPTVTLIIAIFLILQFTGLYNTLTGVILVKASLELPLGIWIMKGFYDTVPWEIEMAGLQDGASRIQVFRRLVLPQVKPGLVALGVFSFLAGWSEFILPQVLAPDNDVQVLSVYLAGLIADDLHFDFALYKAVGLFYVVPVLILYLIFQGRLMNIYGGGSKG